MGSPTKRKKKKAVAMQSTRRIIEERIEFLTDLKTEVDSGEEIPMVRLGGMLEDLMHLNPLSHKKTVPFLLECYQEELAAIDRISQN